MTTAEMLMAKGHTEGLARMLVTQLTQKFGRLPQHVLDTISTASPEQLDTWATRVLPADSLDDVIH